MSDEPLGSDSAHPRHTADLVGHAEAGQILLEAWRSERLPHAWLLTGPKGIGKATLAFRFARFVLAQGEAGGLFGSLPDTLAVPPDGALFRRVAAGGHSDLLTIERSVNEKTGKLRGEISVDEVRRLSGFFALTAGEGGWRVAIVDAADELNRHAANALLKILEEPPQHALLLLVAHAPGGLLPTIRSRCRRLPLRPLAEAEVATVLQQRLPELAEAEYLALARLAEGSPGRALRLAAGGLDLYREMIDVLLKLPALDVAAMHKFAEGLGRREAEPLYETFTDLLPWWLARLVRAMATAVPPPEVVPGEGRLFDRLLRAGGLEQWTEVWEKVCRLFERADSVNLDHKQVVLNAFTALAGAARGS